MVITGNVRAGEALERLLAGNRRYVTAMHIHPDQTPARRQELVAGQTPFAAILSCSDSRVVPEIIFDQGLGHLFVVRVAGNIVDNATLGSLEYAVRHLGVPLVLVMGHTGCGAVTAAVESAEDEGQIRTLIAAIQPAVALARNEPGPLVDNAVRANVRLAVRRLEDAAPVLAPCVALGQVMIAGGVYDLRSGAVDLLDLSE